MNEMVKRIDFYMNFHEGIQNSFHLLQQADLFLSGKQYTLPVGDVCVQATANVMGMNLYIYEKIGKKAVIIQQRCAFEETNKVCFYATLTNQEQIMLLTTMMLLLTVTSCQCHYLQQHQQHPQAIPLKKTLQKFPHLSLQK